MYRKVRVYNPNIKSDGWESQRTILDINVNDMPFLIDSVTAELNRQGLRIYQVIHPVIQLTRNIKGDITDIIESGLEKSGNKKNDSIWESVMHFEISYIDTKQEIEKLTKDVGSVLEYARLAVHDWKTMLSKLKETLTLLNSYNNLPFEKNYVQEVKDFLSWLGSNNFTFLGYIEYNFEKKNEAINIQPVKNFEGDLKAPAKLDDELTVHTKIEDVFGATMKMHQVIKREERVIADIKITIACINKKFRPTKISTTILEKLNF